MAKLLLSLLLLFTTGYAQAPQQERFTLVERTDKITEYRLHNGMRVLLVSERSAPVVTVMVLYHVGSRNEAVGHTGATHLLEHMLFKGTPTYNKEKGTQLASMLESVGADYNASTWYDRTNYFETLPSDKLEMALQLEADRMRNAFIKDSDRQAEMTVVRNELEQGENEPASVLDTQVYATAYREHPYHHPTIGWRSDVEGVPTARLKAFYDTFYWPNNATLLLVGDFDEAQALALTDKYFGTIAASPAKLPPVYTVEPKQEGERRFVLRRAGELPIVELAWHTTHGRDADIYPLIVLDAVLTQGVTSRLYQSLVEKNLAVSVSANADRLYDPGLFGIVVTLPPEVKLAKVEEIVREEIERLKRAPISTEELNRAIAIITTEFAFNNDGPAAIAAELAEALSNGDWHIYTGFKANIEKVTSDQIQSVVKKYFYNDNLTVGWFEPAKEESESESRAFNNNAGTNRGAAHYRTDKRTARASDLTNFKPHLPPPAPAQSQAFAPRIKRVKMSNGATLLAFERRTTPTVSIKGTLLTGDYLDPKGKPYLAFITAEMLDKGTQRRTKRALASELERIGASLNFTTETFTMTVDGRCLAKDVEKVFALMAEILRQPAFSQQELDKLKTQIVAQLRQELEDTSERAYEKFSQLVFPPDHPLYLPPIEARIKSIESITLKDVQSFYKSHYGGASLILAVAGDIDAGALETLARQQFENWTGGNVKRPQLAETRLQSAPRRERVVVKDKANADIYIGHASGLRHNSSDYYAALLANGALGESTLSSRLGLQVRDTEGLSYDITSKFYYTGLVDGPWAIAVSVNPDNIDKAINSSLNVVREYVKNGISEKELENQKGAQIGIFKVKLSTNPGIAARLVEMEFYDLGIDYIDRYATIIQTITKQDVDAAIRRYFHPDRVSVVIAGDVKN